MAMDNKIVGAVTGTGADVNAARQLQVITETDAYTNGANVGAVRVMDEVDAGSITGKVVLRPPEADNDYRVRVSHDLLFDDEVFDYTAQNTGKHAVGNTTMTGAFTAGQWTTNSGSITTASTSVILSTYAFFPKSGTTTLSVDAEISFSNQPTTNTFCEWGNGLAGVTAANPPVDGVFFRLSSAGLQGIASFNGTETSTGIFPISSSNPSPWVYTNNKRYQFIVYESTVEAVFWVNDGTGAVMLGSIELPTGQSRMSMSPSGQAFFRHRINGGAAGAVMQMNVGAYSVRVGGTNITSTASTAGNRMWGSYQGLSGGTMGSLANYANSTNPTAAVPTNTTAALGTGLGGQFWETVSLAVNTDGIICSYQVPAATVNIPGRRLVIRGIGLTSYVQTVVVGGPYVAQYSLAFGHTAVSLATAEAAGTKAPRRIALAALTQVVTAAQAVSTIVSQPGGSFQDFGDAIIYVNPGEFVQLVTKHVGTAGTSGTVAHVVTFVYGWE